MLVNRRNFLVRTPNDINLRGKRNVLKRVKMQNLASQIEKDLDIAYMKGREDLSNEIREKFKEALNRESNASDLLLDLILILRDLD